MTNTSAMHILEPTFWSCNAIHYTKNQVFFFFPLEIADSRSGTGNAQGKSGTTYHTRQQGSCQILSKGFYQKDS